MTKDPRGTPASTATQAQIADLARRLSISAAWLDRWLVHHFGQPLARIDRQTAGGLVLILGSKLGPDGQPAPRMEQRGSR